MQRPVKVFFCGKLMLSPERVAMTACDKSFVVTEKRLASTPKGTLSQLASPKSTSVAQLLTINFTYIITSCTYGKASLRPNISLITTLAPNFLTSAVDVERVNGVSVHMIVKRKANISAVGTRES